MEARIDWKTHSIDCDDENCEGVYYEEPDGLEYPEGYGEDSADDDVDMYPYG